MVKVSAIESLLKKVWKGITNSIQNLSNYNSTRTSNIFIL